MIDRLLSALMEDTGVEPARGDHDLTPGWAPQPPYIPAAVLIPIVRRNTPTVLFTTRAATLPVHAGQVSFPGGRVEAADSDAVETALRETREELGLQPDYVEMAGRLPDYVTRTGYVVTPVVGLVTPPFDLAPDPVEVADVFEVPLDFILSPDGPRQGSRIYGGAPRAFWQFDWQGHLIWGATAGMLMSLRRRLHLSDPGPA